MAALLCTIGAATSSAQTPYNLGSNITCNIQASSYLFCSNMGEVQIPGYQAPFVVTTVVTINDIFAYPPSGTVEGANVGLDQEAGGPYNFNQPATGTYSNYIVSLNYVPGSGGGFSGTLTFKLTRHQGYRGHVGYTADNAVLTVDTPSARLAPAPDYRCGKDRHPCKLSASRCFRSTDCFAERL